MRPLILFLLLTLSYQVSLVELFGLTSLLQDLAKLNPQAKAGTQNISAYKLNPNIHTFLKQYKTRTEFCDYKCQSFFHLPCFLLFGCNIHLRNFILAFTAPVFILALTGLCCGKGIWTFSCWMHYLAALTGAKFIIKTIKKYAKNEVKSQKNEQMGNQIEIQPKTDDRIKSRAAVSSSESQQA